ncbi:HEAT repeat domain-containing protein [Halomarina pelagica]|uniref:HEAT repeat domain-containing protein n=1 Tax=Halomarina pelagica TaxID=2961599 RepID=UPI0020C236BD|nr:HEAT repeat domain-containing protein [Halomarina sp. BND7]
MSNGDDEADAPAEESEERPDEEREDAEATPTDEAGESEEADEAGESDESDEETDADAAEATEATPESLDERLDAIEADLDGAETESDLDAVESDLDAVESDVETLPEAEEDAEEDPRGDLEARVGDVRSAIEDQRGPYASDVAEGIRESAGRIRDTRWTERGDDEVVAAVDAFLDDAGEILGEDLGDAGRSPEAAADALDSAAETVENAGLDPDEDGEPIAALLEAVDGLETGLDEAQEWDDLTVVQKLDYQGFYDVLTPMNRKDFPPELSVVRIAEAERDPEPILLAFETFDSDFMQENCIDALRRLGAPEAYDAMMQLANRRDQDAIRVLGKIGNPDALETLLPYIEGDANPPLQRVVLKTVGEIGDESATQTVADRLVADDPEIRSGAARALGMIGDTRAIEPLSDVLEDDDSDAVRASAAWALNQIGTERALEAASEHADDRSYIVQVEAERAAEALDEGGSTGAEPEAAA